MVRIQPATTGSCDVRSVAGDARPSGLLRIAVTSIAEQFLSGPLIASFAEAHPGITIDVTVTDDTFDIVATGFDAGVRLGDVIEQDMVAVLLTKEEREVVVATPGYFESHGTPRHPRELVHHRCIGWRPSPSAAPYRWEFEENGIPFDVAVEPHHERSACDDPDRARWRWNHFCFGRDVSPIHRSRRIDHRAGRLPATVSRVLPLFPRPPKYGTQTARTD